MKQFPWRGTAIGCGVLVVLVIARCVTSAGRHLYYGGSRWQDAVMQDPWFYIGMVAAAVCVAALLVLSDRAKTVPEAEQEENGCGE